MHGGLGSAPAAPATAASACRASSKLRPLASQLPSQLPLPPCTEPLAGGQGQERADVGRRPRLLPLHLALLLARLGRRDGQRLGAVAGGARRGSGRTAVACLPPSFHPLLCLTLPAPSQATKDKTGEASAVIYCACCTVSAGLLLCCLAPLQALASRCMHQPASPPPALSPAPLADLGHRQAAGVQSVEGGAGRRRGGGCADVPALCCRCKLQAAPACPCTLASWAAAAPLTLLRPASAGGRHRQERVGELDALRLGPLAPHQGRHTGELGQRQGPGVQVGCWWRGERRAGCCSWLACLLLLLHCLLRSAALAPAHSLHVPFLLSSLLPSCSPAGRTTL